MTADILSLLDRARYDLQRGWMAAAYDSLARALRLLEHQIETDSPERSQTAAQAFKPSVLARTAVATGVTPCGHVNEKMQICMIFLGGVATGVTPWRLAHRAAR